MQSCPLILGIAGEKVAWALILAAAKVTPCGVDDTWSPSLTLDGLMVYKIL